ncbi:MAG: hypothetical protein LBF49_02455 [Puniceicoccales bacterium]|nr:hypothetical protein [Puniceicoccales bacterium]
MKEGSEFYFFKLRSKVDSLQRKYANNEIKAFLKLVWWLCREFFRALFNFCTHSISRRLSKRNGDNLKVAVVVTGGIGDILVYAIAIKELSKRINCDHSIDLYTDAKCRKITLDFVFSKANFISNLAESNFWIIFKKHDYDVIIRMDRCTSILYYDSKYIEKKSKWLGDFCKKNKDFFVKHYKIVEHSPRYHTLVVQWSILNNRTRMQGPDQCGLLGIDNSTHLFLNLEPENMEILKSFGLEETQYITMQRGINAHEKSSESTRMWPIRHYEKFIELFHRAYPNIKVIQLGYSNGLCKSMDGVDVNLVGKTSLGELAVLLKHSLFHLDGDGGTVHMKRFLNGRSIAIFGPTLEKVIGYSENINLRGDGCGSWCEWVSNDWDSRCLRGFKEAPCMASVSPEIVMEAADKVLGDRKIFSYSVEENNIGEDKIPDHIFNKNPNRRIKIVDVFNKGGLSLAKTLRKNFDDVTAFDLNFQFDSFAKAEKDGLTLEYGCL